MTTQTILTILGVALLIVSCAVVYLLFLFKKGTHEKDASNAKGTRSRAGRNRRDEWSSGTSERAGADATHAPVVDTAASGRWAVYKSAGHDDKVRSDDG